MLPIVDYLERPSIIGSKLLMKWGCWLPDELYIRLMYRLLMGYKLNLKEPITFNEKIQWLKLYNRKPEYSMMVDKYAVKDYVTKIIGSEYIIPTLGVWDKPEDIQWDKLPNQFVLKTTHGGGNVGVIICLDKKNFDRENAVKKLNKSLQQNIYQALREWPYKNVPRRILAEAYITPTSDVEDLTDYKWYCFNGEPKFCQVIQNRNTKETIDFFDVEWVHQDFVGLIPAIDSSLDFAVVPPLRPANLETQIQIAYALSKNIPFSRIDLYQTNEKTYFGEITFYPASGFGVFKPNQYNEILGRMLVLNGEKRVEH